VQDLVSTQLSSYNIETTILESRGIFSGKHYLRKKRFANIDLDSKLIARTAVTLINVEHVKEQRWQF
jgi:hypothetical protein